MDAIEAIIQWIKQFFLDLVEFLLELPILILKSITEAIVALFNVIPAPDFLDTGLQPLFSDLPDSVVYFVIRLGIPEAFAIFAAGVAFLLLRKLLTLFQW